MFRPLRLRGDPIRMPSKNFLVMPNLDVDCCIGFPYAFCWHISVIFNAKCEKLHARVSKGEAQDTRMQEAALRAAGVERLFTEQASGGRWDRPHLHRLLDQLRPEDVVTVWKLDRLSRSLKVLLHIMERIAQAGAGFRTLTEAI